MNFDCNLFFGEAHFIKKINVNLNGYILQGCFIKKIFHENIKILI
jgi:hypothetical protein